MASISRGSLDNLLPLENAKVQIDLGMSATSMLWRSKVSHQAKLYLQAMAPVCHSSSRSQMTPDLEEANRLHNTLRPPVRYVPTLGQASELV
eukprot:gene4216-14330_t